MHKPWRFGGLLILLFIFLTSFSLIVGNYRADPLPSGPLSGFAPEVGHAFSVPVPRPDGWMRLFCRFPGDPQGSTLHLFEDGRPLRLAHSLHDAIRVTGEGRYSHWGDILYFSTSDNSDPRNNGRAYTMEVFPQSAGWLWLVCFSSGFCLLLFLAKKIIDKVNSYFQKKALPATVSLDMMSKISKVEHEASSRQRVVSWIFLIFVVTLSISVVVPLVDTYWDYQFEADASTSISHVNMFLKFFSTLRIELLDNISTYPPYFDGQFLIYTFVNSIVNFLSKNIYSFGTIFNTHDSAAIFSIRITNALAYVVSVIVFYLISERIVRNRLHATLLSIMYLFGGSFIATDLLRIDWLILLLIVTVFYLTLLVVEDTNNSSNKIFLGIAVAFLVSTKITSLVYISIPASAVIVLLITGRNSLHDFLYALFAFLITSLCLFFRYLVYIDRAIPNFIATIRDVQSWKVFFEATNHFTSFYYNYQYFIPNPGHFFLFIVMLSIVLVVVDTIKTFNPFSIVMLASLSIFSVLGFCAMKYPANGYPFFVIYLLIICTGVKSFSELVDSSYSFIKYKRPLAIVISAFFILPIQAEIIFYKQVLAASLHKKEITQRTLIDAREWFIKNIQPKTRIAILKHSEYNLPPVFDCGYVFADVLFDFPYLDLKKMIEYTPPTFHSLEESCDIVLIDQRHKEIYLSIFKETSPENYQKWLTFFTELEKRYHHVDFRYEESGDTYSTSLFSLEQNKLIQVFIVKQSQTRFE